jgi:hypothetical protein
MTPIEYWIECIPEALTCSDVSASNLQIRDIAEAVKISHDNYDMAFSVPAYHDSKVAEIEALKRELQVEKDKIVCKTCYGSGAIHSTGPHHSSVHRCWKCYGKGRHKP